VRAVAPNAHADAHQGPAITLRTILITAPFFSQLIIFRIILWRIRVAKATSKTSANSDVVQSGIEFNAATRSTANLAGPSATGCLSICLSTVPQDAVQHRTWTPHRSQPAQPRSSGPPVTEEVTGSNPISPTNVSLGQTSVAAKSLLAARPKADLGSLALGARRARVACHGTTAPAYWRASRKSAASVITRLDQAGLVSEDDGLGPVAEAELGEQVGEVRLHCRFTEEQGAGDLLV
jgi:hypothetical protein